MAGEKREGELTEKNEKGEFGKTESKGLVGKIAHPGKLGTWKMAVWKGLRRG